MSDIKALQYIRELIVNWAVVITGPLLGLYYTFGDGLTLLSDYSVYLNYAIPALAVLMASYFAWKKQVDINSDLRKRIGQLESDDIDFEFNITDARERLNEIISKLDTSISEALDSSLKAPSKHDFPPLYSIGSATSERWQEYARDLRNYKDSIQAIVTDNKLRIVNISVTNNGSTKESVGVQLKFKGVEQHPDFWWNEIESPEPTDPSNLLSGAMLSHKSNNKLGAHSEIHDDTPKLMSFEINQVRSGDTVDLTNDPLFFTLTASKSQCEIEYVVKSADDKPMRGTLSFFTNQ